ncbi:ATP-binding protein [Streptomyces sp. NPDC003717]|uniref:ATP-binding protein n=1 Tax=Streptomyces sp. NPDC003717 TaxID=3154276 RepID=UPI00339F3073
MNRISPQLSTSVHSFTQMLSSTRRGARLARLLGATALRAWNAPQDLTERTELVVAELAANAVLHGRVPGRDFRLTLAYDAAAERVTVEVTDARGDRIPRTGPAVAGYEVGGRGLLLVAALADHWETVPYPPSGKTVRAELSMREYRPTLP